jgi:acetyltransferase-like isoleucine patch superfamily enzyme
MANETKDYGGAKSFAVSREPRWTGGSLPPNVRLGPGTLITGDRWTDEQAFRKFRSRLNPALVIGADCRMDGVLFNLGERARVVIGDHCCFEEMFLICEQEICIGNRVIIGWRTNIVDSDFHPLQPAERLVDVVACSPLNGGKPRPPIACQPVVIEDDVWIGPNVTILKGTRIGAGALVEPGAVVVHDVPPHARVLGNPAHVVGEV